MFAVASLGLGATVLCPEKGTERHRRVGVGYVLCMFGLNVTALTIYGLSGAFGPFHTLSMVSLVAVMAGFAVVFFRRPRADWLRLHYYWMGWSYVGLCAAAGAEAATRIPGVPFPWEPRCWSPRWGARSFTDGRARCGSA